MSITGNYVNDFAYKIIKDQCRNRIDTYITGPKPYEHEKAATVFWDSLVDEFGIMHIGDARLPDIRWFGGWFTFPNIYWDSMMIHHLFNDEYSERTADIIEGGGGEGPYGLDEVVVEPGDYVIDAGAYIGDFAAVASAMGGRVFAFDPAPQFRDILHHVAKLNYFTVIEEGLGDTVGTAKLDTSPGVGMSVINSVGDTPIKTNTVDNFAKTIDRHIDFIKSDIEGFEPWLIMGAKDTLKYDKPKLAIRTYHDPEHKTLLPQLIWELNPDYEIISRYKTLYAYVP